MIKIYGDPISGNCYKLKLLMELTGQAYEWIDVDIVGGESRTPDFLAKNPNGRVPLIDLGREGYLAESNAGLYYLSQNTDFWPESSIEQARVLQWMFFEQYSHEPYIATSRFWLKFLNQPEAYKEKLAERRAPGIAALRLMNEELGNRPFFVGDQPSIADIALYAYTHVAHEGGFDLATFAHINAWLKRIEQLPGYAPMV